MTCGNAGVVQPTDPAERVFRDVDDRDIMPALGQRQRESPAAAANVTANLSPGKPKATTRIGSNVRTGVDNTFVAPVEIGDDAWIAPGAVITDDVPPGSLAGFAPRQETKEGWVYDRHGKRDDG